jgi:hypothetical protein
LSGEQKSFLQQSVAGLAEEGKVICVRLALFAEMMKGKSWTPSTLKDVGGTEGVNNKIRTLQRTAYGYRDKVYFHLKLYALHTTHYALIG